MALTSSLNRSQKEELGILQIGTFLEYFDLMLYIHMAVVLNDLFFPKTDPHTTALLAAFAFCSTYVMRPIGALIFGWLGDNIGRRSTIIITTVLMSISCLVMANLPTYAQIGITAAWIVTLCRIAQGMSSMGEIIGAEIYVAESISRPASYPAVAFIAVSSALGATVALAVSTLVTSYYLNWRLAFWVGAAIAIIGAFARTRLRETPDFLEMKRQKMKQVISVLAEDEDSPSKVKKSHRTKLTWKEPIPSKTVLSFFLIYCGWPLTFYLAYMYFNPMLKDQFGYSSEDIIQHNFLLSGILLVSEVVWAFLSSYVHPLKILKVRWFFSLALMLLLPILLAYTSNPYQLFCIQSLILILQVGVQPAEAILIYHLPVYKRFTLASFLYAISRALMYILTSFGLVYLSYYFGHYGLWFITLPITLSFLYSVLYFEGLEVKAGVYPNLSRPKVPSIRKRYRAHLIKPTTPR